jgi:hypothetical protein
LQVEELYLLKTQHDFEVEKETNDAMFASFPTIIGETSKIDLKITKYEFSLELSKNNSMNDYFFDNNDNNNDNNDNSFKNNQNNSNVDDSKNNFYLENKNNNSNSSSHSGKNKNDEDFLLEINQINDVYENSDNENDDDEIKDLKSNFNNFNNNNNINNIIDNLEKNKKNIKNLKTSKSLYEFGSNYKKHSDSWIKKNINNINNNKNTNLEKDTTENNNSEFLNANNNDSPISFINYDLINKKNLIPKNIDKNIPLAKRHSFMIKKCFFKKKNYISYIY